MSESSPAEPLPEDRWTRYPSIVSFMKIGRGLTNIVASPLDVQAAVVRVTREQDDVGYRLLVGFAEGVGNFGSRLFAGVVEILIFPLVYDSEPYYQRAWGSAPFTRSPRRSRDRGQSVSPSGCGRSLNSECRRFAHM